MNILMQSIRTTETKERRIGLQDLDKDLVLSELKFRQNKLNDLIKDMEKDEIPYDPIAYEEVKLTQIEIDELIHSLESRDPIELTAKQIELAKDVAMGAIAEQLTENQ